MESAGDLAGNFIYARREVTRGDKTIGSLSVYLTPSYLHQDLRQFAIGIGGVMLIVDLVILILIGSILGRVVVRPIRLLADHAERISGGNLTEEIPIHSGDEIGYLSATMNRMQLSLRVAIQRLQKK